ncbi:RsmE family RNA methyltransferase [Criblamydia sequanensis]|uniref:Ribosomal RNA small subunit methyltransferase E n=1 Tax=Candidatus Criblamydia sequanensis CRIB-18 TaxID=1437425 RepID=A0A090DZ14_9BACT|nr:RsmE family RNA methyltransferase [Criblamydia sequanensis]CDR33939.1 putative RNA methyltransferase [Criblamydia sequanensis CRIB-18]
MPVYRFFSDETLSSDQELFLGEEERRHLNVLRLRIGEKAEIINGRGDLAEATLTELDKKKAVLRVDRLVHQEKPALNLILIQALPKMNRLDTILEKGTELGMDEIRLFSGDLSEKVGFSKNQMDRASHILLSAIKQCGRLYLPKITFCSGIEEALNVEAQIFFGDTRKEAPPLLKELEKASLETSWAIAIGPESGFSSREEAFLQEKGKGVALHKNILRTDTAPLSALTLFHHYLLLKQKPFQ